MASSVNQVEQPSHSRRKVSGENVEMDERNSDFGTSKESDDLMERPDDKNLGNERYTIDTFLEMNIKEPWNVEKIEETITAENLCKLPERTPKDDPKDDEDYIEKIFKINKQLKELAEITTENTELLQNLADKVEDFAVQLLDQVRTKEEASITDNHGDADRYGSLFSGMTKQAIIYGQKKFVSHPFLFKRVKMRWQRGSPFKSAGIPQFLLLLLFFMVETLLTPFLLPLIGYVYYRDQKSKSGKKSVEPADQINGDCKEPFINSGRRISAGSLNFEGDANKDLGKKSVERADQINGDCEEPFINSGRRSSDGSLHFEGDANKDFADKVKDLLDQMRPKRIIVEIYFDYMECPFVIFLKTEFMKVIFIALHCRICILGSTILPSIEEGMVFVLYLSVMLSECEQWSTSEEKVRSKVYFKDMWNWVDVLTMAIYIIIFILRVFIIIRGGDPFHNRLLEIVNYLYGFNTMFLILRLSSILELSAVFGPLQLALFKMVVDLATILVQFAFVIFAFSMALAKIYSAEMSYLISNNQTANRLAGYEPYCTQGTFKCLNKAARQLVWSVFGMVETTDLESHTSLTSEIVGVLYLFFLILSVIMLVNILVALLTSTYEKYRTNWEVEWKFGLAVIEEQYSRRHAIVIPYNILTYPIKYLYFVCNRDSRKQKADRRKTEYNKYFREKFIRKTTKRHKEKYKGLFSLSVDEKLDKILEEMNSKIDRKIDEGINTKIDQKFHEIIAKLEKTHDSGRQ